MLIIRAADCWVEKGGEKTITREKLRSATVSDTYSLPAESNAIAPGFVNTLAVVRVAKVGGGRVVVKSSCPMTRLAFGPFTLLARSVAAYRSTRRLPPSTTHRLPSPSRDRPMRKAAFDRLRPAWVRARALLLKL